jgi:cholesterol transport system auxiliary component
MNGRVAIFRLVTVAFLPFALAGCLNLNKSYPEKRSFVLDVASEPREPAPGAAMVLKINKLHVSPLFSGRAMVYRTADLQYESDFYDEWFVAPGALLTQQLQNWLSTSGQFRFVLIGSDHIDPTHLLEGTVTEFYGDYRLAVSPKAILGIELRLLDGFHEREMLFRRVYHKEVLLADRSAGALAGGLTQALRLLLIDLEKDLNDLGELRKGSTSRSTSH